MAATDGPPEGLCWDQKHCEGGEPIIDDNECYIFEPENVAPIVEKAVQAARDYANGTQGNNVYFMMGSDFQCQLFHTVLQALASACWPNNVHIDMSDVAHR